MAFKAAKCPNCAGELQVPEDRNTVKCMYCGSDIVVKEAINLAGGVNVENLLMLAKNAEHSGGHDNEKEAYKYYSKVLEYDPNNSVAWFGKGALGRRLGNVGKDHLKTCFNNALSFAADKEKIRNDIINICERFSEAVIKGPNRDFEDYVILLNDMDPENITGLIAKGVFLLGKSSDPDAIGYYKKALALSNHDKTIKDKVVKAILGASRDWAGRITCPVEVMHYVNELMPVSLMSTEERKELIYNFGFEILQALEQASGNKSKPAEKEEQAKEKTKKKSLLSKLGF